MLRNYLVLALRNLGRHPGYAFINVAGLAMGVACCILILLFVRDELSYDRFNEKADRIVRTTLFIPQLDRHIEVTPTIVGPLFERSFPEVETSVRVYDIGRFRKVTVRRGGTSWQEGGFMYADPSIFDVFTLPLLWGTPGEALVRPNTLVLTESMAVKYFGTPEAARDQVLTVDATDFEVTGVIEDVPMGSHLRFDLLGSFASTHWASVETWDSANFYTYLLLTRPEALGPLEVSVASLLARQKASAGLRAEFELGFQRLTDIYLVHMGRERYVWLFSALALLILFIACINYVNLATARSTRRAREVGMRKVLGAERGQIVRQFLGESAVMATASMVIGLGLAAALLPAFNRLGGKHLGLGVLGEPDVWLAIAAILAVTTVGAGLYPSMLLARFVPAAVLKGSGRGRAGGLTFRRVLVVFQFAVTVFLFIATAAVFRQLGFIRTTDVGFDRDQVLVIPIADSGARRALPVLKSELASRPDVLGASAVNAVPGNQRGGYSLFRPNAAPGEAERTSIVATPVDPDVVATLGLDLVAGAGFSEPADLLARPDSGRFEYVVNEHLVRLAGWTPATAVGQVMGVSSNRMGEVVGVIRDYHFATLHERMQPLALFVEPAWNVLLVKIAPGDVAGTIASIRSTWERVAGDSPFAYTFLDDDFNEQYAAEERLGSIFGVAAALAVVIACLGLFGLASFTAERRRREIGIRKVLGASAAHVVAMLNREFSVLVLVGFVLAAPIAWWATGEWLDGFAYRTGIGWTTIALAGLLALACAWLTASWQSLRAAATDPAKTLRYE
jgi:putative ABC transport system permease protein